MTRASPARRLSRAIWFQLNQLEPGSTSRRAHRAVVVPHRRTMALRLRNASLIRLRLRCLNHGGSQLLLRWRVAAVSP
uniref:Uncharacterized protein n=1 Tax=Brassica oleracea TaxID=3712 RepID=A0A3P6CX11_BRAOL|nr:unnamed protein product [Brassica oleracea]